MAAITDGGWRYVSAPRPELFDLQSDPGETRNVVADQPEIANHMRELFEVFATLQDLMRNPHQSAANANIIQNSLEVRFRCARCAALR